MARETVIQHIPKSIFLQIRQDYIALIDHMSIGSCPDKFCTAAILSVFEHWTNYKIDQRNQTTYENAIRAQGDLDPLSDDLWIYKTQEDLKDIDLMGMWGLNKISKCLAWLETGKLLATRQNPKYGWDRTKQYLLNVELVNNSLRSIKSTIFNSKDSKPQNQRMESLKLKDASFNSKEAIPKITTKITNKENKKENNTTTPPIGDAPKGVQKLLKSSTGKLHISDIHGNALCPTKSELVPIANLIWLPSMENENICKNCLRKHKALLDKDNPDVQRRNKQINDLIYVYQKQRAMKPNGRNHYQIPEYRRLFGELVDAGITADDITAWLKVNANSSDWVYPSQIHGKIVGWKALWARITPELKEYVATYFYKWKNLDVITPRNWEWVAGTLQQIFNVHDHNGTQCEVEHLEGFRSWYPRKYPDMPFPLKDTMERHYGDYYHDMKVKQDRELAYMPDEIEYIPGPPQDDITPDVEQVDTSKLDKVEQQLDELALFMADTPRRIYRQRQAEKKAAKGAS